MEDDIISITNISQTSYDDNTSWVTYVTKKGYKGVILCSSDYNKEQISDTLNILTDYKEYLINKPHIKETGDFLQKIFSELLSSENDILFLQENYISDSDNKIEDIFFKLISLDKDIKKFNLEKCFSFFEDGDIITVYGGLLSKFLF